MSEVSSSIVIFQDVFMMREDLAGVAGDAGFNVVAQAGTYNDTIGVIDGVAGGAIQQPDVWVIDDDLGIWNGGYGPGDGSRLVNYMRSKGVGGAVVGWSATPIEGADVQVEPPDRISAVVEAIRKALALRNQQAE